VAALRLFIAPERI